MRDITNFIGRVPLPSIYGSNDKYDQSCVGAFMFDRNGVTLCVIASQTSDMAWDHVSVSTLLRCPTWDEMEYIKRKFFKDDELAFQLHVPVKDHVNKHPYVLHLWRPRHVSIPLPPIGDV